MENRQDSQTVIAPLPCQKGSAWAHLEELRGTIIGDSFDMSKAKISLYGGAKTFISYLILLGVGGLLAATGTPVSRSFAEPLPRVKVKGAQLITEEGRPLVIWGVNYFRPGTGWPPQLWRRFDPATAERDLQLLKSYGVNCVRVFLTFGSFFEQPDRLNPEGMEKWKKFLALAQENGIYVHPTGPDHWEGIPEWARRDRFADEEMLQAQEKFWELFARANRGESVVLAYDLLNEPTVGWTGPAMRAKWNRWLAEKYGSAGAVARAWGVSESEISLGNLEPPRNGRENPEGLLLDYQNFRESIADEWVRRQTEAIRRADPEALVTVGLIQWSVPVVLPSPRQYSGFRPERIARWVDFQSIHFYPLAGGFFDYLRQEDWRINAAYAHALIQECAQMGQPVVIGEFGWYGGGKLSFGNHPPASEEDQANWCTTLVLTTAGLASGWLNWGAFDHPEARDVSQLTGLFRADGTPKIWAKRFWELHRRVWQGQLTSPNGPRIPLDWLRARIDPAVGRAFLQAYASEFKVPELPGTASGSGF